MAVVAVAVSIVSSILWALEAWLHPLLVVRIDDRWMLAVAIGAWFAAALAWPGKLRGSWWWRAGAAGVLCATSLYGVSIKAHDEALRMLMGMWKAHYAVHGETPTPEVRRAMEKPFPESWFYFGLKPPPRETSGPYTVWTEYRPEHTPLDHLIETSRWPVRRNFIQRVMGDENGVVLATRDWHRLLPAVVGQDVTLSRRNELIAWLDVHSRDQSAAPACRDAAILWMALIVLTDVPEFERWRAPVRDAMLACDNPPLSLTGDVWMRVLDALLAFDPDPTAFTQPLARNGILLRRAVRERLRGMEGQTSAIMREIETLDETSPQSAIALWLDLKHMVERMSAKSETREIRTWLAKMMFQWLAQDTAGFDARFLKSHRIWARNLNDLLVDFTDDETKSLALRANELVASTDPRIKSTTGRRNVPHEVPAAIIQALVIRNFLDGERRSLLSRSIGLFIADHLDVYQPWNAENPRSGHHAVSQMFRELSGIWGDLDDDLRASLSDRLRRSFLDGNVMNRNLIENQKEATPTLPAALLAFFDSSLTRGSMNEEERLAMLATTFGSNSGNFSYWTAEPVFDPIGFSPDGITAFVRGLANALENAEPRVSFRNEPGAMEFPISWFGWFLRPSGDSKLPKEDLIRLLLVHRRLIGTQHLHADWPRVFRDCPRARWLAGDHSDPRFWRPLMNSPEAVRETIELLAGQSDLVLSGLFVYLTNHPPDDGIKSVILEHYREMTKADGLERRIAAWHVLMRTSGWLDPDERYELRRQFLEFFMRDRPALNDWSHTLMLDRQPAPHVMLIYPLGEDGHRGEGVNWEQDALTARLSWSSQIHHECALLPHDWGIRPNDGLFTHLVNASDVCDSTFGIHVNPIPLDEFHASRLWLHPPPQLPFPPTAWQRARELHLKRPDLHFPDRPAFRPTYTGVADS
jgi:hypothetical protein